MAPSESLPSPPSPSSPSSPCPPTSPMPLHSSDGMTALDIAHPMPDLQSLQGAYVGNIERLEEHAERMSEAGSDLGEEIRKLQLEQKLSDSRRSSMLSAAPIEEPLRQFTTRSRGASTSSYSNSIVDVVGNARWGGYSPAGYVTSPVGSLKSGSFSNIQRQRSGSKASRLGQVVQTGLEEEALQGIQEQDQPGSPQSSFTRHFDAVTNDIQQQMRENMASEGNHDLETRSAHGMTVDYNPYPDLEVPDRPATAASTDTSHRMRTLWQDFDGAHCPDTVPEEPEPTPSHHSGSRESTYMMPHPETSPRGPPPPDDDMVFYPAPVPRMLNLPQRLSKLPAANVQARRRTQLLESMQTDHRKSGAWPTEDGPEHPKPNRKSRQSLAGLPPQLRASAFFDQPAPTQEYEIKGESAEDTLNNILEASANAPVSAFTDHSFAGHVGDEPYGKEHKRKGSKANELDKQEEPDNRKNRGSRNLLDLRRNSHGKPLNKLKKRNSSADLNMLTIRAAESRMSLGDELDVRDPNDRGPADLEEDTPKAPSLNGDEHDDKLKDGEEGEEEEEEEEDVPFGPPTTLLAELQLRKQQQKSRNLTAATAFPNGMHSTLLQLDAVAEIEKKKRRGQKVNLAWEAQPQQMEEEESDEDVPLGILFPGRDGLVNKKSGHNAQQQSDWDRPLGLIAQRELEDSEPLSKRRTRLVGFKPGDSSPPKRHIQHMASQSQPHLTVPTSLTPQPESEEDEGETLAQRARRMKERQTLDDAIGDVRKSAVSADFAAEMMSQFGMPEAEEDKPKPAASPAADGEEEEETLGQRRARLQAEAMARGDANPHGSRPPLRTSLSMADVLGAHPINPNNQARKVSDEALLAALPQGSLLRQSAEKQEKMRASRLDVNRNSSFGNLSQPLLGPGLRKKVDDDLPIGAKIQAYKDKISGGMVGTPMTAPPVANSNMMFKGQMMQPNMSMSNLTLPGQRDSYFPQPSMGMMGMGGGMPSMNPMTPMTMPMVHPQMPTMNMGMMGMQNMGYPQMGAGMPGMRQPSMMGGMAGMQMGGVPGMNGMQQGMNGMPMNMPMNMMEPPMDPRQRAVIDRWRESVMH